MQLHGIFLFYHIYLYYLYHINKTLEKVGVKLNHELNRTENYLQKHAVTN